jgi:hypothetical protein
MPSKFIDGKITNVRSLKFLLFLLLITSAIIPLKLLSLVFITPSSLYKIKINLFQGFYLAMALLTVVHGLFFMYHENYLYLYILVMFFWIVSYIIHSEIRGFVTKYSKEEINKVLNGYAFINFCVVIIQAVLIIIQSNSLNPFSDSASHGDMIKGIFSNSSANMIVMSFLAIYFFYQGNLKMFSISCFTFLMTGYMSGLVILLGALGLVFLLVEKRISIKLYSMGLVVLIILFYYLFSRENFDYAYGYIERLVTLKKVPYKIVSFKETAMFSVDSVLNLLFGAGPGNFSSRAAFVVSGEYVSWWPKKLVYTHEIFEKNHLGIWNHDFKNPWDNINNAANQPFSVYNQLLGEYGFIGVLSFVILYLCYPIKYFMRLTYGKIILFAFLGFLLMDYWFEYLSIAIIFELLILVELKKDSSYIS